MDSCHKPVLFSPLKLRASEPWQGDRWSLNAYCLRSLPRVDQTVARDLVQLGFPLPPQVLHRCNLKPIQLHLTQSAHASEVPRRLVSKEPAGRIVLCKRELGATVVQSAWPPLDATLCSWAMPEALPRLPLQARCRGPILLISLFDGIGCAAITLASLGLPFACVAVELDQALSEACNACFPHSWHFPDVKSFFVKNLPRDLLDAEFWMILIVGGSPCQDKSILNRTRQGMGDPRIRLFQHIRRVFDESRTAWPSALSLAILENVQNAPACFQKAVHGSFSVGPLLTCAKDFGGHVSRPRAWWAECSVPIELPAKFPQVCLEQRSDGVSLQWQGKKCPKQVSFDANFHKLTEAPLPCFTRCFWRPCDRLRSCDHDTQERFFTDGRRFSPHAYKPEALLWKGESWRVPSVREKASMRCIPHAVLKHIKTPADDVAARRSALGNSFHLPSFAMVLCILLSCIVQATATAPLLTLSDPAERFVASRVAHPGEIGSTFFLLNFAFFGGPSFFVCKNVGSTFFDDLLVDFNFCGFGPGRFLAGLTL